MDVQAALTELEALAGKVQVQLVYDHLTGDGMGSGGLCKVKGQWRVIIERRCAPSERLSILAQALSRFDLEAHFLSPDLRGYLERFRPALARTPSAESPAEPSVPAGSEPAAPSVPAEVSAPASVRSDDVPREEPSSAD